MSTARERLLDRLTAWSGPGGEGCRTGIGSDVRILLAEVDTRESVDDLVEKIDYHAAWVRTGELLDAETRKLTQIRQELAVQWARLPDGTQKQAMTWALAMFDRVVEGRE